MKALVTGVAGFIGSTLAERLVAQRRRRRRHRLLHRLLPARRKERNLAFAAARAPNFRFVESRIQDADLRHAARRAHARLSPGGPGRRAEKLGTRLRRLYGEQHRGDAGAARGVRRNSPSNGWCMPRARRSTATTSRCRCARTRCRSRCRRTASASSRPNSSAICISSISACRPCRCAISPSTVRASGRTWAFTSFCGRPSRGSRSRCSATASRRATSPSSTTSSRATIAAAERGVPGRVYNIGGGSRVSVNQVLEMIGRVAGPAAGHRPRGCPEGRHAAHVCRHRTRAAPTSASRPSTDLEQGLAAEYAWLTGIL